MAKRPGRWPKGVSGNPGGRPVGVGAYVRDRTDNLRLVVDFYILVLEGKPITTLGKDGEPLDTVTPHLRDRMEAGKWLADRGAGKVADEQKDPFESMSDEEIENLLRAALAKRQQTAPSTEVSQ